MGQILRRIAFIIGVAATSFGLAKGLVACGKKKTDDTNLGSGSALKTTF